MVRAWCGTGGVLCVAVVSVVVYMGKVRPSMSKKIEVREKQK